MSAHEIVELIKAMQPEERQKVAKLVREFEIEAAKPVRQHEPDWDQIIEEVFDEHDELFRKLAQ